MEETTLRFIGEWPWALGLGAAVVAAAGAWLLYRRESRRQGGVLAWLLPTLRALAIFLVVLLILQPVLRHEKVIRQLGRLFVLVDSSGSMALDDAAMPVERKVAIMGKLGLLDQDTVFESARGADRYLRQGRALAATALGELGDEQEERRQENLARRLERQGLEPDASLEKESGNEDEDAGVDLRQVVIEMHDSFRAAEADLARVHQEAAEVAGPAPVAEPEKKSSNNNKRKDTPPRQQQQSAVGRYRDDLLRAAKEAADLTRDGDFETKHRARLRDRVREVVEATDTTLGDLGAAVARYASATIEAESAAGARSREALARFDAMPRWERIEATLLGDENRDGLLGELAAGHDIELIALDGGDSEMLWWQRRAGKQRSGEMPARFEKIPDGRLTDLAEAVRAPVGSDTEGAAVLLLSDGRHNNEGSPDETARLLGSLGVPVYAVGYGSEKPVPDIAVSRVRHPSSVFVEDRVKGEIVIGDLMPGGGPHKVEMFHDGEVVWESAFEADGAGDRVMEFDFSIRDLVGKTLDGEELAALRRNMPLGFEVAVTRNGAGPEERITGNNRREFLLQAFTRKRRVLLIDGRPRWESRYLKNLFQRDEQWEINPVLQTADDGWAGGWRRGSEEGMFPKTAEELLRYDLVLLGDVSPALFRPEELGWLADFVEKRGGGLVFIDGRRGFLSRFAGRAGDRAASLIPVVRGPEPAAVEQRAGDDGESRLPRRYDLTEEGGLLGALRLVPSAAENEETWNDLKPPHWVASATPQPGAEVVVEAVMPGGKRQPVMVWRRFGAGKVFYVGTDELWRMRYEVADRWHQRFWMQIANWIGEAPFAVEGDLVSIAADKLVYREDEPVDLRVRLRDEKGAFVDDERLSAVFHQDGVEYAEFELEPDGNGGGIYRGRSGGLQSGSYEVAIRRMATFGVGPEFEGRMELRVEETPDRELERLTMDQPLLAAMAGASGGRFFYEEDIPEVKEELQSVDRKEVIVTETELWSSYWWFVPVILLLGAEWALRKRAGFV